MNSSAAINNRMDKTTLFALLCEGLLAETSTAMDLIKDGQGGYLPGGFSVIRYLHTNQGLSPDVEYEAVTGRIMWTDLKAASRGAWVIFLGPRGVAALKARGDAPFGAGYEIVASTGNDIATHVERHGGRTEKWITDQIGKVRKILTARESGTAADTKTRRTKMRTDFRQGRYVTSPGMFVGGGEVSVESIMHKLRSTWAGAIKAALADAKGMHTTMVKNDAFGKAERKLTTLKILDRMLTSIEDGDTSNRDLRTVMKNAIVMTASHYYPAETGDLRHDRYGGFYGVAAVSPTEYGAENRILKDISAGDTRKLVTVLAFFKQELMRI